jgi:hypothetical protein
VAGQPTEAAGEMTRQPSSGSSTVRKLALGRPSDGIAACVRKIIAAARQDALHIVQAADAALAELPP